MAEFNKCFRGYDPAQVEAVIAHLSEVIAQKENALARLTDDYKEKEEENMVLRGKLKEYKETERAMQDALISARKVSAQMLKTAEEQRSKTLLAAREESNRKLEETERTVQQIVHKQDERLRDIRKEYGKWVSRYNHSVSKYRSLLEAQLNLLADDKYRVEGFGMPDVDELSDAEQALLSNAPEPFSGTEMPGELSDERDALLDELGSAKEQPSHVADKLFEELGLHQHRE